MVGVAVEEGSVNGDAFGSEGLWGDWLGLAKDVGSGVVAVSLFLSLNIVLLFYHLNSHCHSIISTDIIYPIQTTENCSKRGRGYQLVDRG